MARELKDKAMNGFVWVFAGTLGQNILQFLSLVILARVVTPIEFGLVSAAMLIVGFLRIFSEFGVGPAIVQRAELKKEHIGTASTLSVALGVALCMLLYVGSASIAAFFNMQGLSIVVQALAFLIPLSSVSVIGQSLLQRELRFKEIAVYNLISYSVGYAGLAIPMAIIGYGVWSLVFAQLAQVLVGLIIFFFKVPASRQYDFKLKSCKDLLDFGFGFSLARLSSYFASEGDKLVVGKLLGAAALGVYSNANRVMYFPINLMGGVLDKVLFPIMSSVQSDKDRLGAAYVSLLSCSTMIVMPFSLYLVIYADEIVAFILGGQWDSAAPVFQILVMFSTFRLNYKFSDLLAKSMGAVYRRALRQVIYAAAVLFGAFIGHFYGLNGVAFGVGIAYLINYALMLDLSQRLVLFRWRDLLLMHAKHFSITLVVSLFSFFSKKYFFDHFGGVFFKLILSGMLFLLGLFFVWFIMRRTLTQEIYILNFAASKLKGKL